MSSLIIVLAFYYQLLQTNQSPEVVRDYIVVESLVAGVDPQKVMSIVKNESQFNSRALHENDTTKGCNSRGLVQIRSCDHDVTDEQAYNPVFSVNFLIRNIDKCTTWWKATCPIK